MGKAKKTEEPAPQPKDNFTDKQRLFIEAYLGEARCNATQAARLAGYSGDDPTLWVTGSRDLLGNPKVRAAIDARLEEVKARVGPERIYQFYADLLDSDITDTFKIDDATGLPAMDMRGAKKAGRLGLIKSVTIGEKSVKIDGYCKDAAVANLAKLLGLTKDEGATININPKYYTNPVMNDV